MFSRGILSAAFISAAVFVVIATPAGAERNDKKVSTSVNGPKTTQATRKSGRKMPPFAYIKFCVENPSACKLVKGRLPVTGNGQVKLTGKLQIQLASVNSTINRKIQPKRDVGTDTWTLGAKKGDCEDYVLAKRAELIRMGWPSRALAIAVVRTRDGQGHAVLVVDTDRGKFILDNVIKNILPKSRSPHQFLSMQDSRSAYGWEKL